MRCDLGYISHSFVIESAIVIHNNLVDIKIYRSFKSSDLPTLLKILLALFIVASNDTLASEQDFFADVEWKLKKDKRGIQVYTGKIPGSPHRAVFSTMVIESSPRAVTGLLLDLQNCREWASMCKLAKVEQQISDTESIIYGLNDLPFPAKNRDSYSRVSWRYDPVTNAVDMASEVINDPKYEIKKGAIRLTYAHASWRILPLEPVVGGVLESLVKQSSQSAQAKAGVRQRLLVENYLHIDPNGQLPSWLTNMLAVDAPYRAMRKMRTLLETGQYDNAEVAFMPPRTNHENSGK